MELKLQTIVQVEDQAHKAEIAYRTLMAALVESLRGKAMKIAFDIGSEVLMNSDQQGLKDLRTRIKEHVFPQIDEDTRAVYNEGYKHGGVLARHQGEPMREYIYRRENGMRFCKK